jgi:ribonuclease D
LTSALRPQKEATETLEEAAKEVAIATKNTLQKNANFRECAEKHRGTQKTNTRAIRTLMKKRDRKAQERGAETR